MRQRFVMILTVSFLLGFQAGCGTDHEVYLEQISTDTEQDTADDDTGLAVSQTGQGRYAEETESQGISDGSEEAVQEAGDCYVHVCGAVQKPGVYVLPAGSRVYEAVGMAGGLTADASDVSVNQAGTVWDGQMLYIPTKEEAEAGMTGAGDVSPQAGAGSASYAGVTGAEGSASEAGSGTEDHRVNLNTATAEELMTLSGIGSSKAADIIAYRETNGGFSSPEEIMQISGIKEGLYNRIKDDIKVK